MTKYAPFDQDAHLAPPPWKPDDPALVSWEAGHGHDVRLKCYPEFGCQAIEDEAERLRTRLARVRRYVDDPGNWSAIDGRRATLLALLDGTP